MNGRLFFCTTVVLMFGFTAYAQENSSAAFEDLSEQYSIVEHLAITLNSTYTDISKLHGKWKGRSSSPSGDVYVFIGEDDCDFYFLEATGYFGPVHTSVAVKFDNFPKWITSEDGREILILDVEQKRGLAFTGRNWEELDIDNITERKAAPEEIHAQCKNKLANGVCFLEALKNADHARNISDKPWEPLNYALNVNMGQNIGRSNQQKITIEYIGDLSKTECKGVVLTVEMENFVWIDFETNSAKEIKLFGDRWGPTDYSGVRYSPDGNWLLASINYFPHGKEPGGHAQLFTTEGEFVESIAHYSELGPEPSGGTTWKPNNWIVVNDFEKVRFFKFDLK